MVLRPGHVAGPGARLGSPVVVGAPTSIIELLGVGTTDSRPVSDVEAEAEPEHAGPFRSSFSWPPPKRTSIAASALIVLVLVVLVVLLITNGSIGRVGTEATETTTAIPRAAVGAVIPAGWSDHTNSDPGYAIAYPPAWQVTQEGPVTIVRDPQTGAFLQVDGVTPPGEPPMTVWLEQERTLSAAFSEYRRLQIEPTTYRGYPGAVWEFVYSDEGVVYRAVVLGLVAGQYRYALYFETPDADWLRLAPTFYDFAASFRP